MAALGRVPPESRSERTESRGADPQVKPKPKPRGKKGKIQTGFRADEALLRRFRSQVQLHGHTMSYVIEMLIEQYLEHESEDAQFLSARDQALIEDLRAILRIGGDLGHALNCILRELRQAIERNTGKGDGKETRADQ